MNPFPDPDISFLAEYLEASRNNCAACIDQVNHDLSVSGVNANLRFHYLRFDGNGQPKLKDLAEVLVNHVVEYALSMRSRDGARKPHEIIALGRRARELFTLKEGSGEAGEMLLYMLLEAILEAPQVVAKMDLKTSPHMEVFGSDGVHVKWCDADDCLDLYFLESKLEKRVSSALRNAFNSIAVFHEKQADDHEIRLVTSHFKHLKECEREAVLHYVDRSRPGRDARINHACLIGFDYDQYSEAQLVGAQAVSVFKQEYERHMLRVQKLLQSQADSFTLKHLRLEMFFLPFPTVNEFRKSFVKIMRS
ncbi:MAG: DUF1837 domain-containing protein [Alphaproteobacteria bacterium]|nr:MAG: DUF1837 domain-containing protein [Alphaproteobacteria bacterium]